MDLVPKPYVFEETTKSMMDEAVSLAQADDRMRAASGTSKVYFVQEDGTGAIKIGTSKQLKKRVDELARQLPSKVKLLAMMDGCRETECVVHRRFHHVRIRGEWFRPVPELLAYIDRVRAGGEP
jgi:hypothetical protein